MPNITLRFSTYSILIAALLTFVLFAPFSRAALNLFASETSSNAARTPLDMGGQAASPNPSERGVGQEERVRQLLAKEYDQLHADEASIRKLLGMSKQSKTADFLGYNSTTNRWVIAESKASDVDKAWLQLKETAEAFVKAKPAAQFELRL